MIFKLIKSLNKLVFYHPLKDQTETVSVILFSFFVHSIQLWLQRRRFLFPIQLQFPSTEETVLYTFLIITVFLSLSPPNASH